MIKKKIDPALLDELKYGFLELAATDTVEVSSSELRFLVKKHMNTVESLEDRFIECFGAEDDESRVSFD